MTPEEINQFARQLVEGQLSPERFAELFSNSSTRAGASSDSAPAESPALATADLGAANLDLDRRRRCGFPEVVYGEGKSTTVLSQIFRTLLDNQTDVLATRIDAEKASVLTAEFKNARYNELARTLRIDLAPDGVERNAGSDQESNEPGKSGRVAIVTAGTSDLPVAEETRETLDWMGVETVMLQDVGVAGPHRLPEKIDQISACDAVVVIAGMEGALPSIVGGYVACPVIGVPTSVGYGANFHGVSALLSMLNSCAANVAVVNIDAGFKGAYLAGMIAKRQGTEDRKQGKGDRDQGLGNRK